MPNALTRAISGPVTKPFRTKNLVVPETPQLDDDGFVTFSPDDIENPHNWSTRRRWAITFPAIWLVMNATYASSSPSGCFKSIAEDFQVSEVAAGLTITLFLLGYVAGPLVFAPLSECYGRRWVFYITFMLYMAFNFLCAFAPNFGSLLVGRFLTGTFVSAPLSNGPGLLADLWDPLERGNAMAAFSALLWIGPALGPVVAGFLELTENWRWSFYVLLWLGGFSALLMFTLPETHGPTILAKKAARIRAAKIPGFEDVKARAEVESESLVQLYKVALTRPWVILFDTISLLCAIYMSVVYTLLYMLFTIYPLVFQEKRGWNAGVGELPLCGTIVGAFSGALVVLYDTHLRRKKISSGERKVEDFEPEDRLPLAMIGGVGFAVSMFWFAWTAEFNWIHWIVPTIAGAFLGASLMLIFVGYLNYIVDSYLTYAASAIAANTIARSACGSAAPLFTTQMFTAMGIGGGGSLIGGLATVLAIIPFMFYKYGKQIRVRSKFAPTDVQNKEKVRDEERDPTEHHTDGEGEQRGVLSDGSSTIASSEEGVTRAPGEASHEEKAAHADTEKQTATQQ